MKYKCLVLDHDDTVVNSTATIHFPSFLAYLEKARPGKTYTLEEYFRKNFDPGVVQLFTGELGFTPEEMDEEYHFWQSYVKSRVPAAYPGMREILQRHRAQGGLIAVISHSVSTMIERDYRENDLPLPDVIYGWEYPAHQRKPNPWPMEQLMQRYDLRPDELLMVDDLKPGYDMCRACHTPFAAAGWANDVPEIERFMRENCDFYFKTVKELDKFLQKENA